MEIIRNRAVVKDEWKTLNGQEPLPEQGDLIVPLERWWQDRADLERHSGRVGVKVEPTDDVWTLEESLKGLSLVAISFPKFADGRGYSQAWILRHHLGFGGELRATGDVLRDQLRHMSRCGFNAFEVREGKSCEDALKGFDTFSVSYQQTHPSAVG